MDFEQFCRTTMLAQGEFTQFLKSDEKDKSAILEKLTGNDVYSRIGKRIYDLTVARKTKHDNLQAEIGAVEMLTDERKAEIESEIAKLEQTIEKAKADMAAEKSRFDWLQNLKRIEESLSDYRMKYDEAGKTISSDDFRIKERMLADWKTSSDARNVLNDITITVKDRLKLEERATENSNRFVRLVGAKDYYLGQQRSNDEQMLEVQKLIDSKQKIAPMLGQAEVLVTKLRDVLTFIAQIDENDLDRKSVV